jgi:hypothetical protein
MTSRELVRAALAHEETERVPYCILTTGETDDEIRKVHARRGDRLDNRWTGNRLTRTATITLDD